MVPKITTTPSCCLRLLPRSLFDPLLIGSDCCWFYTYCYGNILKCMCVCDLWPSSLLATNEGQHANNNRPKTIQSHNEVLWDQSSRGNALTDNIWIKMPPVSQTHAVCGPNGHAHLCN